MAQNYAQMTPRDKGNNPRLDMIPAMQARARQNDENASASSILYLGHNTTELEIAAVGQHVAARWFNQSDIDSSVVTGSSVVTAAGSGTWDFIVQKDTAQRVAVPIGEFVQDSSSVVGINRKLGLYTAIGYKTLAGNGSVLTAEY